jgi:hypothetical protein
MKNEEPYVAPFIRRRMPNANTAEMQEASENLKSYLQVLWRIYLRGQSAPDSPTKPNHDRFRDKGGTTPNI